MTHRSLIAIQGTGLVTAAGSTAAQSCSAFRAKVSNPTETRFKRAGGEWIVGHQVQLERPWRGVTKLAKMAAMACDEAMQAAHRTPWLPVPVLLCVAESERPARTAQLDDQLLTRIQAERGVELAAGSAVFAQGHVGVAAALLRARQLITGGHANRVLVVAADSLLSWPCLAHLIQRDRLLSSRNSNGFVPGEAAGALLLGAASGRTGELLVSGLGFGHEEATVERDRPLRGDGLTRALKLALAEVGCDMFDVDYRISDVSGEQYYFKEISLALNRTLRQRKEDFELWHPAEVFGECGAAAGLACLVVLHSAASKAYAPGPRALLHLANDGGSRAAVLTHAS